MGAENVLKLSKSSINGTRCHLHEFGELICHLLSSNHGGGGVIMMMMHKYDTKSTVHFINSKASVVFCSKQQRRKNFSRYKQIKAKHTHRLCEIK
jgi:hypothetical protein